MGLYNILEMPFYCPKCRQTTETEVEFKIGILDLEKYRIGEKIKKSPGNIESLNGFFDAAGYVECPKCDQDYFLNFEIQDDLILKPEIKSYGWHKE